MSVLLNKFLGFVPCVQGNTGNTELVDFSAMEYKILITKPKIAGMGMNFQPP